MLAARIDSIACKSARGVAALDRADQSALATSFDQARRA
jgi:hypothetical protein